MREYVPKDWRVSKARWLEMVWFCRQYESLKEQRNDILHSYTASGSGSIAVQSSNDLSPVERKADRMSIIDDKIRLIELCVSLAVENKPELYDAVLEAVTTQRPLDNIISSPIGGRQLGKYKRKCFYILDKKL